MSLYVTQFYQAFPRIITASDKRWVRRPGYEATSEAVDGAIVGLLAES